MTAQALQAPRFVRRTQLGPSEYRKNFRQIDGDVISAVTSEEADRITPLMSKIYLRLIHAPAKYWEREGVLRFEAEFGGDSQVKAWDALCEVAGVASATASKALRWMHEQGIVGYFAGKNGVGIRVFINRAASSIGSRTAGKKILEFPPASSGGARASQDEAAFSDSFAVLESLDTDRNPRAPKNGADTKRVGKTTSAPTLAVGTPARCEERAAGGGATTSVAVPVGEIVGRLKAELEPCVRDAAARAAAQSSAREMERTREWFETKALPKAVRVPIEDVARLMKTRMPTPFLPAKYPTIPCSCIQRRALLAVADATPSTSHSASHAFTRVSPRNSASKRSTPSLSQYWVGALRSLRYILLISGVTASASRDVTAAMASASTWRKFLRYSFGASCVRRTNRGCGGAVAVILDSLSENGLTANRRRVNCVCFVSSGQSYARSPSSEFRG